MQKGKFLMLSFAFIFLAGCNSLKAQTCVDDYYAVTYTAANATTVSRSLLTASNEIICCGNVDNSTGVISYSNGWMAKFTANGTVLWSKRYTFSGYTSTVFEDVVQASDNSYWVVGEVYDSLQGNGRLNRIIGVLLHIDTYGNIIQSHIFDNSFLPVELARFYDILKTDQGDFIVSGTISLANAVFLKIITIRIDNKGNVKWITRISSRNNSFNLGLRSSLVQQNNKIILGCFVLERHPSTYQIFKEGYFFANLDYETGHLVWSKTYTYFSSQTNLQVGLLVPAQGVVNISLLANGKISFQTSFSDSVPFQQIPYTKRSLNIITDASGNIVKALAYYNTKHGCTTADVAVDNTDNSQLLLMDDGTKTLLVNTDKDGAVKWQKGYRNIRGNPIPATLLNTRNGSYIFINDRYNSRTIYLLKTGFDYTIACANDTAQMITEDASGTLKLYQSDIYATGTDGTVYALPSLPILKNDYSLTLSIDCRKPCCTDITDTAAKINLCDVASYTLPDNNVVKESGTYYTVYKTLKGCDSIRFEPVMFLKKPDIEITGEICLEGKDSIVLKATPGFTSYNWMNTLFSQATYTVRHPGIYWAEVSNLCGVKRDSIEVLDKCNFEIYMPNAFTPNGDGLNDSYGFSGYNKNKFIKLSIYNRWGQVVFETTEKAKKWDGTFKNNQQPAGVFIYYLQMETLNGRVLSKKGTITLIR